MSIGCKSNKEIRTQERVYKDFGRRVEQNTEIYAGRAGRGVQLETHAKNQNTRWISELKLITAETSKGVCYSLENRKRYESRNTSSTQIRGQLKRVHACRAVMPSPSLREKKKVRIVTPISGSVLNRRIDEVSFIPRKWTAAIKPCSAGVGNIVTAIAGEGMEGTDGRLGLCNLCAPFYKAGCGHIPVPISEIQVHPGSADVAYVLSIGA